MKAMIDRVNDGRIFIRVKALNKREEVLLRQFRDDCDKRKYLPESIKHFAGYVNVRFNGECGSKSFDLESMCIEVPFEPVIPVKKKGFLNFLFKR